MDYKKTLNLPKTKFKMKANLAQKEPEFLKKWEKEDLYGQTQETGSGKPIYMLHDGPPYANGHIHLGTAFNKVLKDIILKSKRMAGYHCPYIPGWDCHGLPIEHNVDKDLGEKKKKISKLAFRGACRKYAQKWIRKQKEDFKRLGVLGDWENPYLTINFEYETAIAREFNRFLLNGSVIQSKKPVHWCSSCVTALAEAEVEHYDHTSPSIYVKFALEDDLSDVVPELAGKNVSVVIWTTTPWTLPANLAVAFHPKFTYAAVEIGNAVAGGNEVLILAEGLVEQALKDFGMDEYTILASFSAAGLEGRKCKHPFLERESLLVLADYVTLETGTGCVHTAPGHGRDDYMTGLRYGLEAFSPVDNDGRFTHEAGPYSGLFIWDANPLIIDDLSKNGSLIKHDSLSHSYPHCWRCKKPVIFRATEQWFISMEKNDLRRKAMAAIKEVAWTPKWGMERIYGMVETRPDWCLSRQRAWGVPLTVLYCKKCGEVANNEQVNDRICELFAKEGADAWFSHDSADFLGAEARCAKCGSEEFAKEEDILDVWFDSGVSYAAVLEERNLPTPADLYLEGSDQHRGWFQSSLLASVGTRGIPPYKGVLTHGFVVDGKGKKMSKSIGNVVAPSEIINKYGAEILRMWVAFEDYRDDIKISDEILKQLSDGYRKIRNTIRYFLGNISDFDPAAHGVDFDDLDELDRWALLRLEQLKRKVAEGYEEFEFHTVMHSLHYFCTVTMSSFYLDIIKDRLYTSPANSRERRSAQTVLYEILDSLLRMMAPVLSFTVAEVWSFLPVDSQREANPFVADFVPFKDKYLQPDLEKTWKRLLEVRSEVTRILEIARRDKVIGHSLEAEVWLSASGELGEFLQANWQQLETIAIVSALHQTDQAEAGSVESEVDGLSILVKPARGEKCERCWIRSETVGLDSNQPEICERCLKVMMEIGQE